MPRFLLKLPKMFRRSSSSRRPDSANSERPLTRKELKRQRKNIKAGKFLATTESLNSPRDRQPEPEPGSRPIDQQHVVRRPAFITSSNTSPAASIEEVSKSFSGSGSSGNNHSRSGSRNDSRSGSGSASSGQRSRRSGDNNFKVTNQNHSNEDCDSDTRTNSTGPENDENHFEANFPEFTDENENTSNQNSDPIRYDQIQNLEAQYMDKDNIKPLYPQTNRTNQVRLPNGQLVSANSLANGFSSPMSQESDFDLSTDAEDNEYNKIRNTATDNLAPMLEQSAVSSDDDESIGLNTIRKNDSIRKNTSYLSSGESDTEGPQAIEQDRRNSTYFSDSDFEPESERLTPGEQDVDNLDFKHSHSGSAEDSGAGKDEPSTVSNFQFEQKFDETLAASQAKKKKFRDVIQSPSSGGTSSSTEKSLNTTLSPRTIAIQQAQNMRRQGKLATEHYPDTTDSERDDRNTQYQHTELLPPRSKSTEDSNSTGEEHSKRRKNGVVIENFADFGDGAFGSSQSVADPTSPVSELLRQAKDRRNRRKEASSVNSAPIINSYLQQHKLASKREKGKKPKNTPSPARTRADDASASASSAAKEKLRRRRYEKAEYLKSLNTDSDEGSGNGGDENETWLIDEVTGALGPRGIAADLESLGERSGLSKTSHKSRGKGNRRDKKNNRSDGSISSRHSRHSRSSRYSHKSSKSQASIVSEHSRSVSNDLLRLEMQLARVGSRKPDGDVQIEGGAMVSGSGSGLRPQSAARSTQSRPKNNITKRVKLTVVAPAGKLGIILANKTDAKGTVVSGVRTTSALADRISPGDRILEIDGEDVSRMTVSEITAIMTRQKDYERVLVVLTTARDSNPGFASHGSSQCSDAGHENAW